MTNDKIYVTQPFLPPLEDFLPLVEEIWASGYLTNGGPLHQRLENALAEYLGVEHLALFNNGTIALITALQALDLKGEVITTPFSFVATTNALIWNKNTPVFVDIDPVTANLDPTKIEAAITDKTTAILPVHCYGNPCDMEAIREIADRRGLKVVYDAAHAFGVQNDDGSVLQRGDLSTLSLHATKVFNTFEGGAVICRTAEMKQHINELKNFGIVDETTIKVAGSNGKMSEIHAAMGLAQLHHIDACIARRGEVDAAYRTALADIPGLAPLPKPNQTISNYAYFPISVTKDYPLSRDEIYDALRKENILTRRYFYPLLSTLPMYADLPSADPANLPVATEIANQVLCLPIFPAMADGDVTRIIEALRAPLQRTWHAAAE
ncbi:DegT/DnrJ/EryC1/StrS family aminotransferase [Tritonibacter scottomollicae]|uniref:dTDP-4-amino-4,6-dideoxygalactose transaminase n=1 Tax=Tritonibacter scottomollicae TaxID=483013 RepID=A0A2T1A5K8_TRISK|nr:DegT/DnrJ/EryC1/StrS family aminotransferase [Tritonibacter scottomollicae]PRZ43870.1 dTDP-4-amino-4,6-dideoxygalactose transaminase [Tritonibacter scottomollicae]